MRVVLFTSTALPNRWACLEYKVLYDRIDEVGCFAYFKTSLLCACFHEHPVILCLYFKTKIPRVPFH
jgi:hypothetical protein